MLRKQHGFTIIELLTVIAIIGVLAAFLFPVITSAKDKAKETQCTNNMHQIWTALKAFQQNEGRYPDFIAGPCPPATPNLDLKETPGVINGRPMSLYPEYIKSEQVLYCPMAVRNNRKTEFPRTFTIPDPIWGFSPKLSGERGQAQSAYDVYPWSTYDVQYPRNRPFDTPEVHYSTVWLDADPANAPNYYVRQLRWKLPPEDTVVTWCSYHRETRGNEVKPGSMDLVLFLDGHVKPLSSARIYDHGSGPDYTTQHWEDVWKNAAQ